MGRSQISWGAPNFKKEAIMSRFNFQRLHVQLDARVWYSIYQVDCPPGALDSKGDELKHPRLMLSPATKDTPGYWQRVLTHTGKNARRLRGGRVDPAMLEEVQEHDLNLYPRFIVREWEGVFDEEDKPVSFNRDECEGFLRALPDWIFMEIRNFASEPTNFLPEDEMAQEEASATGEG